jgi:hypothetical protein
MNLSIRTKFALGLVFFFVIIVALSILSTFQLNRLSKKTSAILKENHVSVVYAREMSEKLNENRQNKLLNIKEESEKEIFLQDVEELGRILARMKIIEEQASGLLSKFKTPEG